MAHVEHWVEEDGTQGDPIYVVTHAVGGGASNKRDDVLLVQYFLKKIYSKPSEALSQPSTQMVVDGYFGPITRRWILMFQNDVKRAGFSVYVDGRVDPAVSGKRGSISREIYTILHMDNSFKKRFPEIHAQMSTHIDVPAQLRASLSQAA